ncbi:uncharacterized protein LOC121738357 [Aricia agestis]|uniref:uncharacterized protein LOC121738357 n=1 Tax=Aricia agestis TaxID=91739 RepID=UPI001C207AD6|nr:uncharacterized protein LOC121738357 [Aricia agestis]XP_041986397.1 uncharacterized protein LOC121738357 [Aricia agestis]
MDPVIDSEWLGFKNDPIDEPQTLGNVARSWQWRERGIDPPNSSANKMVLENIAEDILVKKPLKIRCCDLPGYPRSTFLMVFSPDGTKVASSHANHNVYVSDLATGKHVRILKGHPRTPWCIAFHPSHPQLIGSGCLGGQVRVWDISSGGSEVWNVRNETVISSIAFHPSKQLLVIATYNELYFWDWSQPAPFTKVTTNSVNEKVRYVAFDSLGYKLITGISLNASAYNPINMSIHQSNPANNNDQNNPRRDESDENGGHGRNQDSNGSAQDLIVNSYQNLVQRYDSLVRNYQRLFMVRHRLSSTPSPPSTTDRGTDPMETDPSPETNSYTRVARTFSVPPREDDENSTTREDTDPLAGGDGEAGSSRIFNLDALSFDTLSAREPGTSRDRSSFGSRQSAFQPLNDGGRRTFRTVDQRERTSRLLPNPFSSTNVTPRPSRFTFTSGSLDPPDDNSESSRTRVFLCPTYRSVTPPEVLDLSSQRSTDSQQATLSALNDNLTNDTTAPRDTPSTSAAAAQRETPSANASTPMSGPVDAQTINESLDLIRDILRDSGTRLLNLITNMSLSTLANVERRERSLPRRRTNSRAQSDENDVGDRARTTRPRVRLFSSSLRQEFLSSSSESDGDRSPEVNIFRTRNTTFREDDPRRPARAAEVPYRLMRPTDRLVIELGEPESTATDRPEGVSVTANGSRFRVRSQSNGPDAEPGAATRDGSVDAERRNESNPEIDLDRPSTSRDNLWVGGVVFPPDEAYRKVREGVNALQKHTTQLTNLWLRGSRITMRELRNMWENLRRRILMLHREPGRRDVPTYFTRSLLERCMMLSDMTDQISRGSSRTSRINSRNRDAARDTENGPEVNMTSRSDGAVDDSEPGPSTGGADETSRERPPTQRSPQARPSAVLRSTLAQRRRPSGFRLRLEEEFRRRSRNSVATRLSQRYSTRPRREIVRAVEISATRHEIRMRAMQVLSVMFNMMMMCLEERGLSQLIINMLRILKKALALTCLMLMTNRPGRAGDASSPQRVDPANVIRLENIDNSEPINVDGPDEPPHNLILNETEDRRSQRDADKAKHSKRDSPSDVKPSTSNATSSTEPTPSTSSATTTQRWSNRLAVQIAAANRNNSATARNRRELYMESKRLKALHRTNPAAHPLAKRKVLPPVSTYRIPALRWASKKSVHIAQSTPRAPPNPDEPVAGPSGANSTDCPRRQNHDVHNFEYRINLIRMAHMQAVRLRNAARNRFRRLQTIRLYTPSSVREMFTLQPNGDDQQENRSNLQNGPETSNRRSLFYEYTTASHVLSRDRVFHRGSTRNAEGSGQFQAVIGSASAPLLPGEVPTANSENRANQPPRRPRIHDYLQPIILAQNAMVVDEEGGAEGGGAGGGGSGGGGGGGAARRLGGMAGLLDAGIISEALPPLSHRIQAWNFAPGLPPDISDSTKNIVVQKCRIHNDASIDISKDGRLLVALLPVPRLRNTNHWLGVYSLEWSRLGQCLHTAAFEHSAVSVALSPTARHLAVGLGARRFSSAPARTNLFALLYRLDPLESSSRTGLSPIKELEQTWEHGFTSLNCLRWAPQPGQGLVYADNTGQLIIMS